MAFLRHDIVESLEGGLTRIGATLNPVNADAEGGATNDSQVQSGAWSGNPTAILAGTDIQPQVETVFYSPVVTIGGGHLPD